MTRDQFLDWAGQQEVPYEFDGSVPVAMTGGNRNHSRICRSLVVALDRRLAGTGCEVLPEAGLTTVSDAVRYPDVPITRTAGPAADRVMPGALVVFEVVSPISGHVDRITKMREYPAVSSILRYVIVDNLGPDLTVYFRAAGGRDWTADVLTATETLIPPELGIDIAVDEVFRRVEFNDPNGSGEAA